jgi:hemerythrin-like domain-containing protein
MEALESLAAEHRLIARTLDAFDAYIGYVEARIAVDRLDLQRFVLFFEDFAGLHHHDKEETLLFPALVSAGLDWDSDPLARLRREHDQEDHSMRALEHAARQSETWSDEDRTGFVEAAKGFIAFQREHLRFENGQVYPRATSLLSEEARLRLRHDVERFDRAAEERNARLSELAEHLMRRYVLNQPSRCQGGDRVQQFHASSK